jgi:hypothetical protein
MVKPPEVECCTDKAQEYERAVKTYRLTLTNPVLFLENRDLMGQDI